MLFTLLLTAFIAILCEDTYTAVKGGALPEGEGVSVLPSGLAGSDSEEEGASLTWTGESTTGKGERVRNITLRYICQSLTKREERPKAQLLALKGS